MIHLLRLSCKVLAPESSVPPVTFHLRTPGIQRQIYIGRQQVKSSQGTETHTTEVKKYHLLILACETKKSLCVAVELIR